VVRPRLRAAGTVSALALAAISAGTASAAAPGLVSVQGRSAAAPGPVAAQSPLAAAPSVQQARVFVDRAGRATADVDVSYGEVTGRAARRLDRGRTTYTTQITVRIGSRSRAVRSALLRLVPGRRYTARHRLRLGRIGATAGERLQVSVIARVRFDLDGRGGAEAAPVARRTLTTAALTARRLPRPAPPRCEALPSRVNYGRPVTLAVTCLGAGTEVHLAGRPRLGRVKVLSSGTATLRLTYTPPARRVAVDRIKVSAVNAGGTTAFTQALAVQPFRLRALGDSATAAYGFLTDGTPMTFGQFLEGCIPLAQPNNRCSSNSPNGVGSTGPVGWSDDFGLANNVAWPAQFANNRGLTGTGQFENWAVTGSVPADWDTGGYLNSTLESIVDDNPDLTVMTLGANPLLDTFLRGAGIKCAFTLTDAQLRACIQRFITSVGLIPHLRSVIALLLAAPDNRVVVSLYHLAVPASTVFSARSIGILFDTFNANITQAVQGVSGFGTRVFLMSPPHFNVGRAPGNSICVGKSFLVDGPSRQSQATQDKLALDPFLNFCGSPISWIISADTGIHPNVLGHAQFAAALSQVVTANGLMPALPPGPP